MTQYHDQPYFDLVKFIRKNGYWKQNRTGTETQSVFGYTMRFDLRDGTIPLLTSKKMFTRGCIIELFWYLSGSDNIRYLQENNVHIWDEWADENGDLNKVYGFQWRHWKKYHIEHGTEFITREGNEQKIGADVVIEDIDQIANLIDKLKNNPDDRRMIVTAWNVADIEGMGLPPCHYVFQCYTREVEVNGEKKRELSMILNQRSCDVGLGVPFNIVQYSMLLRMLAHVTNMTPGDFIWNGGDTHIYADHLVPLEGQLQNEIHPSPTLKFAREITDINDFKLEDFIIEGYNPGPVIKMNVAV